MGEDLIDNPQLHRPSSKELRPQLEDDLAHHIHCLISNQFYMFSNHLDYEIHEHTSLGSSLVRFFKVWGWLSI